MESLSLLWSEDCLTLVCQRRLALLIAEKEREKERERPTFYLYAKELEKEIPVKTIVWLALDISSVNNFIFN